MSRVLVIGCGGVASVAIQKCCQADEVFTELCIASRTKEKCDALVEAQIFLIPLLVCHANPPRIKNGSSISAYPAASRPFCKAFFAGTGALRSAL